MKFTVLMSVYKNDRADFLEEALESVVNQTVMPNELLIIQDGKLTKELEDVLDGYASRYSNIFKSIKLEENVGLGKALNIGVKEATYDIIARMDSDDICINDRFEKQLNQFKEDAELIIVGSSIYEFYETKDKINAIRTVPLDNEEIKKYAKRRNPMNHMTVMYKKAAVLEVGNYQHLLYSEDYYLWARMIVKGFKFKNIKEPLVYARTGEEMYKRRGGLKYVKTEYTLQMQLNKIGLNNKSESLVNFIIRSIPRILPNSLREKVYLRFLRKKEK